MAVKRTRKTTETLPAPEEIKENAVETPPKKGSLTKKIVGLALFVLVLVLFWYKTNSWPIVALVGTRPVTRFEIAQTLFKQGGKILVDDVVTELIVRDELNKNKISISDSEVNSKVDEIRKSLGTSTKLEDLLAQKQMTMSEFLSQVKLQMEIEKMMQSRVKVTDEEVNTYIQQNKIYLTSATDEGKRAEALNAVRMSKLQSEVNTWVTDLKAKFKVWKAPGL
jgi:hypothetical protein